MVGRSAQLPADLNEDQLLRLLQRASDMTERAYAPYSRFHVGAALLADDGQVFTGCNVENAAYGLTICAEQSAVCQAISAGVRRWQAIAVRARKDGRWADPCLPCGACRQVLLEFAPQLIVVTSAATSANRTRRELSVYRLDELLASPFRPERSDEQ